VCSLSKIVNVEFFVWSQIVILEIWTILKFMYVSIFVNLKIFTANHSDLVQLQQLPVI